MFRFIVWMALFFVAVKIVGEVFRYVRLLFTPNANVLKRTQQQPMKNEREIQDIPYEEIKED